MTNIQRLRSLGLLGLLAVCAVALAACGSSSSSGGSSSSSSTTTQASASGAGSAQRTKLRACLQQHGVTLPTRPSGRAGGGGSGYGPPAGGGGGGYGPPAGGGGFVPGAGGGGGFAQRNPKLAQALKACGATGRFGQGGGRFRLDRANLTKYVSCVRSHGYKLPSPNFSGKGPVFPASIRTNQKFQAASRACQSLLVPNRPGGMNRTTATATKSA